MIEATSLTKQYGNKLAVEDLRLHRPARRCHRLPRSERIGEVDNDEDDHGPRHAERRGRHREREALPRSSVAPA